MLGVSRPIYVNVALGSNNVHFLGYHLKNHPVCRYIGGVFGQVVSPHDSDQRFLGSLFNVVKTLIVSPSKEPRDKVTY